MTAISVVLAFVALGVLASGSGCGGPGTAGTDAGRETRLARAQALDTRFRGASRSRPR